MIKPLPNSLAKVLSWVTTITHLSALISFKRVIICLEVTLSKFPVGSSAKIISGFLTSALAIATLCLCPPDNSLILSSIKS